MLKLITYYFGVIVNCQYRELWSKFKKNSKQKSNFKYLVLYLWFASSKYNSANCVIEQIKKGL